MTNRIDEQTGPLPPPEHGTWCRLGDPCEGCMAGDDDDTEDEDDARELDREARELVRADRGERGGAW